MHKKNNHKTKRIINNKKVILKQLKNKNKQYRIRVLKNIHSDLQKTNNPSHYLNSNKQNRLIIFNNINKLTLKPLLKKNNLKDRSKIIFPLRVFLQQFNKFPQS